MKRFFKKTILLGLMSCVCVALFFVMLTADSIYGDKSIYYMAFFKKQEMLVDKQHQQKPSVILLGGSNIAFGFKSKMIEEALDLPVINTGLHAGFGLKFMLDHTSKYLTKGDILIIAPEYDHFFNSMAYGGINLIFLFYLDPRIGVHFGAVHLKKMITSLPTTKDFFLSSVLHLLFKRESEDYNASGFNEYGDYTDHWTMPSRPYPHASISDFKTINMKFLDYYQKAVAALRERGIQVIIIPPSFSETSYNNIEEKLIPLFSEFERRDLGFSIPPQESAYPDSLFFDTHYHLGYEGVLIRTNQLIQLMQAQN
ncbi:MAG: hypothetical protein LBI58_00535 [Tannerellaceae bacterium]|jgi:hypothetical protein|nr:hypothetical protein [Tannerellaceae bacterium]